MDKKAFYKLTYGLFLLSAREEGRDNACIINTAIQVANDPARIAFAVLKGNHTHDMILRNGVFAISYTKTKSAALGLTTLCAYRKLTPVIVSGDFMLTETFIGEKFGVNTRKMAFPERKIRREMANRQVGEESLVAALTTREGLAGAAYAVTGARTLRSSCVTGVAVQMIGGILGLLIMLALTVVHAEYLLTPVNLLLYELVWMIPGLLITERTRFV